MDYSPYYNSLLKWIGASREYLHTVNAEKNIMFYGTGDSVWGVNTLKKAFAAYTVASEYDAFDEHIAGMTREKARSTARGMLRYALETHLEGSMYLTDGKKWGHTWISSLGLERVMHALDLMLPELSEEELMLLKRVQCSECDFLCDTYVIEAERYNIIDKTGFVADYGKTNNKNKPESNVWNGAVLYRTAMMFPDAPRASQYKARAAEFFVNGISVASDAQSGKEYDGRTVASMFVGDNFFESYALDHHGYLNLGYAALPLSNIAMLHYAYQSRGLKTPEAVFHHAGDLWSFIKACTFEDGTLCRVGGDARTRYCYCQDFMVPILIFARDVLHDPDAENMEYNWMNKICYEQALSGDGSYLLERCASLKEESPLYYTRLESDRALSCSIGFLWNDMIGKKAGTNKNIGSCISQWSEPYHGACILRSDRRLASWCWRGAEGPTGLCVPRNGSDYAEYRHNMFAEIRSHSQVDEVIKEKEHSVKLVDGGFLSIGRAETYALRFYAEAEPDKLIAVHDVAVAALPDDGTMLVMQRAKNLHRAYLKSVKPGYLLVQNDIFNGKRRIMRYERGEKLLLTASGADKPWRLDSKWANFDDTLGVTLCYGDDSLSLYRPSKRQIGISGRELPEGMLYAEEVCIAPRTESFWAEQDEFIVDAGFAVFIGIDAQQTKKRQVGTAVKKKDVRCAGVCGADGRKYMLAANFGADRQSVAEIEGMLCVGVIGEYLDGALSGGSLALFVTEV